MIIKKAAYPDADPRIIGYMEHVLEGRITACVKMQMAAKRMHDDLMQVGRKGNPWVFDGERASRPIRFMEKWMVPGGEYDRMELMPWQCFFEGNLFGWRHRESNERMYRKALLLVGSGNGKSPLLAGTALYAVSQEGLKDPHVDIFANSREQSEIILNDCGTMITNSAALSKHFKVLASGIRYGANKKNIVIRARSSDARKLDGIRPTIALFDEVHEARTYRMIQHALRSLRKAKGEQLLVLLSTMGTVLDGVLAEEYELGDQVLLGLAPEEVARRELVMIYEIDETDDPANSECWIKANPSLDVLLRKQDLIDGWARAEHSPQLRSDFINKTCNVFTKTDGASYLDHETIQKNNGEFEAEALRGMTAYAGIDAGGGNDHFGACVVVPLGDGRFAVTVRAWVTRQKALLDANKADYLGFAADGDLVIVDAPYVNQQLVIDWLDQMAQVVQEDVIGFDPARVALMINALSTYRGEGTKAHSCEAVRQGALTLSEPMHLIHNLFVDGKILFNNSRLFRWYLHNTVIAKEEHGKEHGNWMPQKKDANSKIDGFMAFLDAMVVYYRRATPEGAIVQEPDVQFIQLSF